MGKASTSYPLINKEEHEVSVGKQNARAACPKNKLEFKFFLALLKEFWT